jgi:DNA-directed RNA polymerase subunit RPC12/RpoP
MVKSKSPPSKLRYNEKNKVVSFLCKADLKKEIDRLRGGLSYGQFVRDLILRKQKVLANSYKNGFEEAIEKFAIETKCAKCGTRILIPKNFVPEEAMWIVNDRSFLCPKCTSKKSFRDRSS